MGDGHAVQVVILEDHTYRLDIKELKKILERDDVKDLPVAVVSVAGAFRGGKSFLLNFMLRYLMAPQSARDDGTWLGADDAVLRGFSWRGGSERNTTGILMWSEPMFCTSPTGEKIAVLLMDTQGTFDATSSVRDCSIIFALSTLVSSVQVYNISQNIKEDDLQYLQLFTNYGKLLTEDKGKAFQVLEFLIRDWPFPWEYAFGVDGGKMYIENKLKIEPEQPKELQELRQHIRSCFDKVTCFLMPHPGLQVLSPKFEGKVKELSPHFKTYLKELATSLFASEKLCLKEIHGTAVKASELCVYFTTYMEIFNSNLLPTPTTILKATSQATLQLASSEARKLYESTMEVVCGSNSQSMAPEVLHAEHTTALEKARKYFLDKKKMASESDALNVLNKLVKDLDKRLDECLAVNTSKMYLAMNEAKEAYEKYMTTLRNGRPFCVHPLDVTRFHNEAVNAAMKAFDQRRRHSAIDNERQNFLHSFNDKLHFLEQSNELNNRIAINEINSWYLDYMRGRTNRWPPMSNEELSALHNSALDIARRKLDEARLVSNTQPDTYSDVLTKKILPTYQILKAINDNELNRLRIIKEEEERNRRERYEEMERNRRERERYRPPPSSSNQGGSTCVIL